MVDFDESNDEDGSHIENIKYGGLDDDEEEKKYDYDNVVFEQDANSLFEAMSNPEGGDSSTKSVRKKTQPLRPR